MNWKDQFILKHVIAWDSQDELLFADEKTQLQAALQEFHTRVEQALYSRTKNEAVANLFYICAYESGLTLSRKALTELDNRIKTQPQGRVILNMGFIGFDPKDNIPQTDRGIRLRISWAPDPRGTKYEYNVMLHDDLGIE